MSVEGRLGGEAPRVLRGRARVWSLSGERRVHCAPGLHGGTGARVRAHVCGRRTSDGVRQGCGDAGASVSN